MATTLERKQAAAAKARRAARKRRKSSQPPAQPTDSIDPNRVYPISLVPKLFGIGRETLRKAEAEGMKALQGGSRKFVKGSELIGALERRSA